MQNRRKILQGFLATASVGLAPFGTRAQGTAPHTKAIPSTGERLPMVGLGSWITFNVGNDRELQDECASVMGAFFQAGGRMIDCSPMYGSSQPTIGYGLKKLGQPQALFSAEKVWISNAASGPDQIARSRMLWGVPRFDLLQVHNLLSWERHLPALFAMKNDMMPNAPASRTTATTPSPIATWCGRWSTCRRPSPSGTGCLSQAASC